MFERKEELTRFFWQKLLDHAAVLDIAFMLKTSSCSGESSPFNANKIGGLQSSENFPMGGLESHHGGTGVFSWWDERPPTVGLAS